MPDFGDINWLGVVVAVVAMQILGFLWYGPLFEKAWLAGLGKTQEEMGDNTQAIVGGVVASALTVIALALILSLSETPDVGSGIKIGLLAAVGFAAMTTVQNTMYEVRNRTVMWIHVGYQLVAYAVAGGILGAID